MRYEKFNHTHRTMYRMWLGGSKCYISLVISLWHDARPEVILNMSLGY